MRMSMVWKKWEFETTFQGDGEGEAASRGRKELAYKVCKTCPLVDFNLLLRLRLLVTVNTQNI